jgi:protein SCO1
MGLTVHNQRKDGKIRLVVCGFCCLLLALTLAAPPRVAASDERGQVSGSGTKEVSPGLTDQNTVVDQDWVNEKTGDYLPLDTEFTDSSGKDVTLRTIIDRPTLILPIYFFCPNSCSLNLSYLANAVRNSSFKPGVDFKIISFSFNAEEKVEDAGNAKVNYLKMLSENFPADDWKFLVGTDRQIKTLLDSLGYRVKRMPDGTYAHPSALVAVSAEGRVIKYIYGSFMTGDVDMALLEAKKGTPALSVKRLLGFCFNTDSKNSTAVLQQLKIGLLLGSMVLGGLFVVFLRRSGKKKDQTADRQE